MDLSLRTMRAPRAFNIFVPIQPSFCIADAYVHDAPAAEDQHDAPAAEDQQQGQAAPQRKFRRVYTYSFSHTDKVGCRSPDTVLLCMCG